MAAGVHSLLHLLVARFVVDVSLSLQEVVGQVGLVPSELGSLFFGHPVLQIAAWRVSVRVEELEEVIVLQERRPVSRAYIRSCVFDEKDDGEVAGGWEELV